MAKKKTALDGHAMSILDMARQYHEAAEELFAAGERRASAGGQRAITALTYFLYFHTMELAFKAYLRAYDRPIPKTHELTKLYEECRTLGLVIGLDDRISIGNIVNLLESGNEYQGFRYFNLNPTSQPDLAWTREVGDALMRKVSGH
jgi:HEPN domain-containing protein